MTRIHNLLNISHHGEHVDVILLAFSFRVVGAAVLYEINILDEKKTLTSSIRSVLWMKAYICLKSKQTMAAEAALNVSHCCMCACSHTGSVCGFLPKLCSSGPHRGMAQMRKLACDGIRTNSRGEPQVPLVSARQEILTSLVSALDSVVRPRSGLSQRRFILQIFLCGLKMISCS